MTNNIRDRLAAAIELAERRSPTKVDKIGEAGGDAEQAMQPVRQAAEEMMEALRNTPSVGFTINPESVAISLVDRELWISYEDGSETFVGEESAHSWYDGERYSETYRWENADTCIEAMIRLCAQYVQMARAINNIAARRQ